MGFPHVEVDSNGIRMAESLDYCRSLKESGLGTVYLQFYGLTPESYIAARSFGLLPLKRRAISKLRSIGIGEDDGESLGCKGADGDRSERCAQEASSRGT